MPYNASSCLTLVRLGIDTQLEYVVFMLSRCPICKSEGFEALTRVEVQCKGRSIIATLNAVTSDLIQDHQASLSESAWAALGAEEGDDIMIKHVSPVESFHYVRQKMLKKPLSQAHFLEIIQDIVDRRYSNTLISSFITAYTDNLDDDEVLYLTQAMLQTGDRLSWPAHAQVVDKHCIGGVPGNRTTPIVVAICAENGLIMPKTSSRAITSPAGTADTLEVMTQVDLDSEKIISVVNAQNGCFAWGGALNLSPADDILIRVERALTLDSEGQMIASILSKKASVGSTYVLIDIPVGPHVKVKNAQEANRLSQRFITIGKKLGLSVDTVISDGTQPIGNGIGPTLEMMDVLNVLQQSPDAPQDLKEKSIQLAAQILASAKKITREQGLHLATETLESGRAYTRFKNICQAQGRFSMPHLEAKSRTIHAQKAGQIHTIHVSRMARVAKLSGAPKDKNAGVFLHKKRGDHVTVGDPLFTVYADSEGILKYSFEYIQKHPDLMIIQ